MAKKLYELTEEHRAQLGPWRDKWIAHAMSTAAMTDDDRARCRAAVLGLYEAAKLPPPKHVVFVPSPFVLTFAGGFAAAIWHLWKGADATRAATRDATSDATRAATSDATHAATYADTSDATRAATWYPQLGAPMSQLAREMGGGRAEFLLSCAERIAGWSTWDGGNQWAGWASYLSFFRHVAKLPIDYSKWDHYETLAMLSGPRVMTTDFCMISDKPEVLTVDAQNRPHNDMGPFCRWRDGTALYAIHGHYVAAWIVEHPERITVEAIHQEQNAELRRIMVERYGLERYVRDAQFEVVDADLDPLGQPRRLLRKGDLVVVELTNSTVDADGTRRTYHVPCHPELRPLMPDGDLGSPQKLTARNAVASTYGMRGEEYVLAVET